MPNSSIISIKNLSKHFARDVVAVDNVSLDIAEGELFALLGPSGCGKTTLLRAIAGFEVPSEGTLSIDGEDMHRRNPNQRPVNMVFQSYAVFPHMSVAENVGYGLKVTGTARNEIANRVAEALALVKLDGYEQRNPSELSGGQRQRVALARALVKRPKVLLLDEPLSALDAKLREAMQLELVRLRQNVGITFVIVTHDQDEALSMADRIAVMDRGKVLQVASPAELYEYPNCRFVAGFIGKVNIFEAHVSGSAQTDGTVSVHAPALAAATNIQHITLKSPQPVSGDIAVAVRPEKIRLQSDADAHGDIKLHGRVKEVAYYGNESHVYLESDTGLTITAYVQNSARDTAPSVHVGRELWICWDAQDTLVLAE